MDKKQKVIHFSEMQRYLDLAYQHRQTLNIKAFRSGGYMRIVNPMSHQLRLLPEIFIYEVNGMKVYL